MIAKKILTSSKFQIPSKKATCNCEKKERDRNMHENERAKNDIWPTKPLNAFC